jgi:hypothetical protein
MSLHFYVDGTLMAAGRKLESRATDLVADAKATFNKVVLGNTV